MINLNALLEPYAHDGRTIGGQIKWLLDKGIPQDSIDYAITTVYSDLAVGKIFTNGAELDAELLVVAKKHHHQGLEEQFLKRIGEISTNIDLELKKWNSLSKWQKIVEIIMGRA